MCVVSQPQEDWMFEEGMLQTWQPMLHLSDV
jgi:hypothetical protein